MKPYVIEIATFQYKNGVKPADFWTEDAKVENLYTSQQPGYISRESGYSSDKNEVVVVVRWESLDDAEASMNKFMGDPSVSKFAGMIDTPTMAMVRYEIK